MLAVLLGLLLGDNALLVLLCFFIWHVGQLQEYTLPTGVCVLGESLDSLTTKLIGGRNGFHAPVQIFALFSLAFQMLLDITYH